MKLLKLPLAAMIATACLGALVASASAGRLSSSTQAISATWTRLSFTGGFGTIGCSISLAGSLHAATHAKTAGTLIGYITEANVTSCSFGGVTILRETLPWHRTYRLFAGTLPNITGIATDVVGFSYRFQEPAFGASCLARSTAASPMILTSNREAGGRITSMTAGGSISCGGAIPITITIGGTSSSVSALTVTLI